MIHGSDACFLGSQASYRLITAYTRKHARTQTRIPLPTHISHTFLPDAHIQRRRTSPTRTHLHSGGVRAALFCHSRWYVSPYYNDISLTLWASICCGLSGPRGAQSEPEESSTTTILHRVGRTAAVFPRPSTPKVSPAKEATQETSGRLFICVACSIPARRAPGCSL